MTLGQFVVRNVLRNKRRTTLTVFSIAVSLFLVVTLRAALEEVINPRESDTSVLRLATRGTTLTAFLPISHGKKIEAISGVKHVMPMQWFGGQYRDPKDFFPNFAVDAVTIWSMFPEFVASPETQEAFKKRKDGCVVGEDLMEKYGWTVGDRLTLKGTFFPVDLEFEIVGTYRQEEYNGLYFRWDYMNEALGKPDTVQNFWIMAENEAVMPSIAKQVDEMFRNTANETRTETEKAFRLEFLSTLGNVRGLVGSILTVIIFTMVLVSGSTMAMTIRERTREIGILKSMGFPRRLVLGLILGEALFIAMLGLAIACVASLGISQIGLGEATMGFIQRLVVRPKIYVMALTVAISIGFLGSIYPALRASGMTITQALRRDD